MTESMENFSAAALDEFLTYLAEKGLMPKQTVAARRAACSKMLGVLESSERADIRKLNLDEVAVRFQNLEGKNYTPDSLKTYKSRALKAIEDFLRYRKNPSGFRVKSTGTRKKAENNGKPDDTRSPAMMKEHPGSGAGRVVDPPQIHQLSIPVPIRENLVVHISDVPFDLSKSEAQKIANVIMAMANE